MLNQPGRNLDAFIKRSEEAQLSADLPSDLGWQRALVTRVVQLTSLRSEVKEAGEREKIDTELIGALREHGRLLREHPEFNSELFRLACAAHTGAVQAMLQSSAQPARHKLAHLASETESRAFKLGALAGRGPSPISAAELKRAQKECEHSYHDLFAQHPSLRARLDQLRKDAEERGGKMRIDADRHSIRLQKALGWFKRDGATVHQTLTRYAPEHRPILSAAFQDRFGEPLEQAIQTAFNSPIARTINHLQFAGVIYSRGHNQRNDASEKEPSSQIKRSSGLASSIQDLIQNPELSRASALISDDRTRAAADSLFILLRHGKRALPKLLRLLQDLDPEERKKVSEEFARRRAKVFKESSLEGVFHRLFKDERALLLSACCRSEDAVAHARLLHLIVEKKIPPLEALLHLSSRNDNIRSEYLLAYQELYGEELTSPSLAKSKIAAPLKDWIIALREGDPYRIAAARLRAGLTRATPEWAGEVFYLFDDKGDEKLLRAYEQLYSRSARADIQRYLGKRLRFFKSDEATILTSLINNGDLTLAERIRHCLDGLGADFEGTVRCLKGRSAQELADASADYSARFTKTSLNPLIWLKGIRNAAGTLLEGAPPREWIKRFSAAITVPRNLTQDLRREFGGHERFEVLALMKGTPLTLEDRFSRLDEKLRDERVPFMNWLFKRFSPTGRSLYRDLALLTSARAERDSGRHHPSLDKRIERLLEFVHHGCNEFREFKRATANLVSNISTGTVAAGATFALFELGVHYSVVAPSVFAISLGLRGICRKFIQGHGFGPHDFLIDVGLSAVEGATAAYSKLLMLFRLGFGETAVRGSLKILSKTFAQREVFNRFGRLYQKKVSHHVKLLEDLENEEALSLRPREMSQAMDADLAARSGVADTEFLNRIWKRALRS